MRVHDHIDAIHADAKQPTGFDHFEALVEERGRVDGDLRAHVPSRVAKRLLGSDLGKIGCGKFAKRAAGCGEYESGDFRIARVLTIEALKNRVVLAVDRKKHHAIFFGRLCDHFAGHHENFL